MPPADEPDDDSSDYYSVVNTDDDDDVDGEDGGYNSGRGDRILNGNDEEDDDEDDDGEGGARRSTNQATGTNGNDQEEEEEEVIEISSRTHGVPSGAMSQIEMLSTMASGRRAGGMEVEIVSLERYTFANPELAAEGPAPLEPPIGQALMGVDALQLRGTHPVGHYGETMARYGSEHNYDHDGLISDFTEERNNRRLARIARRLLLPDSYVEACYELHEFLATDGTCLATESVQRNTFKCLKICARLSKLQGYSIQHMWQVIKKAHERVHEFTPPRANTIGLWHAKLTNRIRMMAVTPAADGSAPQRLPTVPPPELVGAHMRDKLLPLPEVNVAALNDARFNRAAGTSGASYYLANPIAQQTARILPPISEQALPNPPAGDTAMPLAPLDASLALTRPLGFGSLAQPASDGPDPLGLTAQAAPVGSDSSISTREAELAIIEHQLEELEQMPPHRMGPMLRAALNLLVEMRFRLRLGLPRSSLAEDNPLTAPRRIPVNSNSNTGASVNEEQVIEFVLNRISSSRRNNSMEVPDVNGPGAGMAAGGHGMPLSMLPNAHPGMAPDAPQPMDALRAGPYRDALPRSELRRRRDGDSSSEDSDRDPMQRPHVDVHAAQDTDGSDSDVPMLGRRRSASTRAQNPHRTAEARRRRHQRRPRLAEYDE
ncbi:hypothetical protein H4R19_000238 [Coemansia spiralis]|nr:hypothetical protein H4R19_000238 [Coemansia spiralis]